MGVEVMAGGGTDATFTCRHHSPVGVRLAGDRALRFAIANEPFGASQMSKVIGIDEMVSPLVRLFWRGLFGPGCAVLQSIDSK